MTQDITNQFETLISMEPQDDAFLGYNELLEVGRLADDEHPTRYAQLGESVQPNDLSTIYYTSGSTGQPKGVEITHANIMSQIRAACKRVPLFPGDKALSCLPLAHSFERFLVYYYLASGVPVYFNSDISHLGDDLRDVAPTIIGVVPRILEKLSGHFREKIEESSRLRRKIGRMALRWALAHEPSSVSKGWRGIFANAIVFRKLREATGGCLRIVVAGGAALSPDLNRFFVNAGVPVYQGYGLTEASPVNAVNSPSAQRIGTVGKPFPGVHIRISDEGEILAKGPNIMRRYHNLPEATARTIDSDGCLHTGDLGRLDEEGYLIVTGRKKELLKTSSGEYIVPDAIEHMLNASHLIDMSIIIGEGRPYVTCLMFSALKLTIESETSVKDLVMSVNAKLEHWEQIRIYRILDDTLSVQNGMLTPTMKLKRHKVYEKYDDIIREMYEVNSADKAELVRRAS